MYDGVFASSYKCTIVQMHYRSNVLLHQNPNVQICKGVKIQRCKRAMVREYQSTNAPIVRTSDGIAGNGGQIRYSLRFRSYPILPSG